MADSFKAREQKFLEVTGNPIVDVKELRRLCTSGIVETCGIRALCWRILLKYLPPRRSQWQKVLDEQRKVYKQFVNEMIIKPGQKEYPNSQRTDVTMEDHPLNPNPGSEWNAFFKDNEILLQIDKDVRRLCPDISFFQNPTPYPCEDIVNPALRVETLHKRVERTALNSQNVKKNRSGITNLISTKKQAVEEYAVLKEGSEAHWEVVERILFIYAKLNPGTGYVQGMNEIIGPVYYTFSSDPNTQWSEHAECDTFFCFTNLMAEIRDNFIKTLDNSTVGIGGSMNRVLCLLKECDPTVWCHLEQISIKQEYYLFRWMTLLLSQEFSLPDTIRLWDSLFSDPNRFDLLVSVCTAMIILVRNDLLQGDFSHDVKMLQNYPESTDIEAVIRKAYELARRKNLR